MILSLVPKGFLDAELQVVEKSHSSRFFGLDIFHCERINEEFRSMIGEAQGIVWAIKGP